jgi:hypothetical protein
MRQIMIVLAVALALLAGCSGGSDEAMEAAAPEGERGAQDDAGAGGADGEVTSDVGGDAAAEEGGSAADADTDLPPVNLTSSGDRVVREGTMRLQVDEDGFDAAFERVVSTAGRLGGTVLSSDATSNDEGLTSGSVTVRVPADDYDALLTAISEIGEVRERSITSEDVSSEFVDLEARLRHNEAQERFYLSLLEQADDVEDAIAVQQRVEGIQQTIEQIKGRLSFLEERTSFSRLTIELFETGAAFQTASGQRPTFAHYLGTARDALVTVLGGALVVGTVVLPFAIVALAVFAVVRRFGPAGRRQGPAGPPAPAPAPES